MKVSDKPAAPIHSFEPKMNIWRGMWAAESARLQCTDSLAEPNEKEKQAKPNPTFDSST